MPSPSDMETNSQYSSCETLDSYRSSECDEKNEVNGNSRGRKVKSDVIMEEKFHFQFHLIATDFGRTYRLYSKRKSNKKRATKASI